MNQNTPNTKAAKVRQAMRTLGRATAHQVAQLSGCDLNNTQVALIRMVEYGHARHVGFANFHYGTRGKFPAIYEVRTARY